METRNVKGVKKASPKKMPTYEKLLESNRKMDESLRNYEKLVEKREQLFLECRRQCKEYEKYIENLLWRLQQVGIIIEE